MKEMRRPTRRSSSLLHSGSGRWLCILFSMQLMAATAMLHQKDREWAWRRASLIAFDSQRGYPGEGPRRPAFSPSVLAEAVALHTQGSLVPASSLLREREAPRWLRAAAGAAPSDAVVMWHTIVGMHPLRRVPTPDEWRLLRHNIRQRVNYANRGSRSTGGRGSRQRAADRHRHRRDDDNATDTEDDEPEFDGDAQHAGADAADNDGLREEGQQAWQQGAFEDPLANASRTAERTGNDVHVQAEQANEVDNCPVCTEPVTSSTVVVHPGCSHWSCLTCAVEWVQACIRREREPDCPSCRVPIRSLSRDVTVGWHAHGCSGRPSCTEMTTPLVLARTLCGVCKRPSQTGVAAEEASLPTRQCAACWMCFHWECISSEQMALWSTAPDICPRCNGRQEPATCPICQDSFTPSTVVVHSGCLHQFCLTCAVQWAQPRHREFEDGHHGEHECPLCREPVLSFVRDVREGWTAEGYRGRPLCMELTTDQMVAWTACFLCRRQSAARTAAQPQPPANVPAIQQCAACWRCYHWACLPSEQRTDWLSDPYVCPRCNGRPVGNGRPARNAAQPALAGGPPVGWQGYAWPAVRLQGPQVAWGPGVGQLQMSFFYVPLFLCGLSRVAGAPPAGYLRAQDVLQWQQIVEDIYSRPAVQDEIRSVTGVALPTPLNLSFDRLVLGVTTVILHVFGDLGDARAIYNAVVRRSDGYVSEENQVSVMSPSDPAIYAVLAHAGMPETVAHALHNDGYRFVAVASETMLPTDADAHHHPTADDGDGGLSDAESIIGHVLEDDGNAQANHPPGEGNESPTGMDLDMSDEEVQEQTDDDIWQQLEDLSTYASPNVNMARQLICRLRVRPRFVRRDGAVLSVSQQADMRRLTMMYELWTGESVPSLHAERVRLIDRMLRQVRASREHVANRSAAGRSGRNAARVNRSLLAGSIPTIPVHDAGRLPTGDPEVDAALSSSDHHVCSACDAVLFSTEVIRERGRVYGRHCCRRGQVALRPLRWGRDAAADRLMTDMWLTRPSRLSTSSLCRRHGRMLNATFAMSCQAVRCRPMLTRGMQTFVVNTRIAHYMGALLPDEGDRPQFAQLYVHDAYTNAPVGSQQQFGHRDALQEYFARSRTGIGGQLQTALLDLVSTIRDVIVRVMCRRDSSLDPSYGNHSLTAITLSVDR